MHHEKTVAHQVLEIGGMLSEPPSSILQSTVFADELASQKRLFHTVNLTDIAHTLVESRLGTIPRNSAVELMEALLSLHAVEKLPVLDPSLGDVVTNREALLHDKTSATAFLGAGRARRETINTGFILVIRQDVLRLGKNLCAMIERMLEVTSEHRLTIFPEYTYLQIAQPTTFGHYLSGFAFPAERDLQRLSELYIRLNRCVGGCGSSNGSRMPQDRLMLADLLGFRSLVEHARDAMWQADLPVELGSCLAIIAVNLSRLAEDLMVYTTNEFGLIRLADRHCRASKIMPQKRNPVGLSYLRNVANHMIGIQNALMASGRTPSGQMDSRLEAYRELPLAVDRVSSAVCLVEEILSGIEINEANCRAKLQDSFAVATDLAEGLAMYGGLAFRDAHKVVGRLMATVEKLGYSMDAIDANLVSDISMEVLGRPLDIRNDILPFLMSADEAIRSRTVVGGAAACRVLEMVEELKRRVAQHLVWLNESEREIAFAEEQLLKEARRLISEKL